MAAAGLTLPQAIAAWAASRPRHTALVVGEESIDYARLDTQADRIAARLQRDAIRPRDTVAICALASVGYLAIFLGALRAGAAVAPLPISAHPQALGTMLRDCGARLIFADATAMTLLASADAPTPPAIAIASLNEWLGHSSKRPAPVDVDAGWPFNIIYSSGTTGTPKGIVQSHAFRMANIQRAGTLGYEAASVTLLATPLYSNMTLATLVGALGQGGTVVMLPKFSVEAYHGLAREHRATHTILVPVQYQRLLADSRLEVGELASFRLKCSTGAPFPASLKAHVLERWPGGLIDIYGMTEGGATCLLRAHEHRDKLHTVGSPAPGHDLRFIDADGSELPRGEPGEIVGHSPGMMSGYLNRPEATRAAEWHDARGKRFIRTGDIGRQDEDGFVVLLGRRKDMIISGGFNVYPSDLEAVLLDHPQVAEAAVYGIPSEQWGETPVASVVLRTGAQIEPQALADWANGRLGKFQRLAAVRVLQSLPRNDAGKVLKRELAKS